MRKRFIPFLLSLVCAVIVIALPLVTAAAEPITGSYTLTLHLEVENPTDESKTLLLQGVEYHLYKVGERTGAKGSYTYTLEEDFKDSGVVLDGLNFWSDTAKSLEDKALLLAKYVEGNDEIQPCCESQITDAKGEATFSGLSAGLYLALGVSSVTKNNKTYFPQATLAAVPFPLQNGIWINPVIIDAKAYGMPIDISVRKVWGDSGEHPSVTVQLLRNGKPTASTTLSAGNNWSNTWENLDSNYKWTVRENPVPSGWQASYAQNGNTFTITNQRSMPPDDSLSASLGAPSSSDGLPWRGALSDNPGNLSLPQTSQLWWPVPLLVAVGAMLLLIGAALFVRSEESEEFEEPYE